jgi:hypothetical protein
MMFANQVEAVAATLRERRHRRAIFLSGSFPNDCYRRNLVIGLAPRKVGFRTSKLQFKLRHYQEPVAQYPRKPGKPLRLSQGIDVHATIFYFDILQNIIDSRSGELILRIVKITAKRRRHGKEGRYRRARRTRAGNPA